MNQPNVSKVDLKILKLFIEKYLWFWNYAQFFSARHDLILKSLPLYKKKDKAGNISPL